LLQRAAVAVMGVYAIDKGARDAFEALLKRVVSLEEELKQVS
jgi:hypothetical protein